MKKLLLSFILSFLAATIFGQPTPVIPPTTGAYGGPTSGDNGVVGNFSGGYTVTGSGAMAYQIPIALPEGTNGMTPQLGLAYNSQGGNGLLGLGFASKLVSQNRNF